MKWLIERALCGCWFAFGGRIQLWHSTQCLCNRCGKKICKCPIDPDVRAYPMNPSDPNQPLDWKE